MNNDYDSFKKLYDCYNAVIQSQYAQLDCDFNFMEEKKKNVMNEIIEKAGGWDAIENIEVDMGRSTVGELCFNVTYRDLGERTQIKGEECVELYECPFCDVSFESFCPYCGYPKDDFDD